ncbi:nucleobase:cation symporter-2 family protein [Rudaeicoccus suwonensis]|uniref:NCS2 family nucleobase:cation symporter-2 n=1 Tax=Rudaeicoccus suwonensis TaxID=657409 RepID=A0A561EA04_9MICO|nr:nucleobase:cation symporter-2 family protein [Rudaeicoccus suwonensis]TWE12417.1 NCS2 family nucleobase:cation symporter-2 [Rudaeicoccus suwonensis]
MNDVAETQAKHPVDQTMPAPQSVMYGLQHVLSMYAGVVAVPLIVAGALKLSESDTIYVVSAALFCAGLGTLLQTIGFWRVGARQPIVQGTSFVAVSTMLSVGATAGGGHKGLQAIYGALIVAGVFGFLIAPVFTRLLHFFPEVVTGSVITMIGLSLIPVGVQWAAGGVGAKDFGSGKNLGMALVTFVIVVLIYRFLPGFFGRIAILLGLIVGTVISMPFGMADLGAISHAKTFQLPTPFHFGTPTFTVSAVISMVVVMLVIMTEATADVLALGQVCEKPADRDTVTAGLRADTMATAVAGVFNGFSLSAFAQNVGLVAITGIRSRFVVAVGGLILVLLGLFPVLGAVIAAVPLAVLGGAGLVLFGTVAASGIRTLREVDFSGNANIVIVASALGFGLAPIVEPTVYDKMPIWFQTIFGSGITSAAIVAVLLNVMFNILGRHDEEEGPVFSHAPAPATISDTDEERLSGRLSVSPVANPSRS